jgi:hypothetical protein
VTLEELKAEAKRQGYNLTKIPCYQCSCHEPYPNPCLKRKDGKWKCVDRYEPVNVKGQQSRTKTKCRRKEVLLDEEPRKAL